MRYDCKLRRNPQDSALADYVELSLQLQFNGRSRKQS